MGCNSKGYTPEIPGGKILAGYCTCTAGLQGGCNHIAAMLFRIESAVTNGVTKPCKTSLLCEWNIPSGNKINIQPIKVEELCFTSDKFTSDKQNMKIKKQ